MMHSCMIQAINHTQIWGIIMKLKNAIENVYTEHTTDILHSLYTPWGEGLDVDHVWEEYPRPQLRRQDYHTLNGLWDYKVTTLENDKDSVEAGTPFIPDGQIVVPFSPESLLSGVGRQLMPDEYLWYQRVIIFNQDSRLDTADMKYRDVKCRDTKCLLHFGAVDQEAQVYVNGIPVVSHTGGYLPFTADITEYAKEEFCFLQVRVRDKSDTSHHTRGKQTLQRGGMFYTAQSGIWQSVWYEWVPDNYIISMKITSDFDCGTVDVALLSDRPFSDIKAVVAEPQLWDNNIPNKVASANRVIAEVAEVAWDTSKSHRLPHDSCTLTRLRIIFPQALNDEGASGEEKLPFQPWTPDHPVLYPFTVTADSDKVESYFAMRCFTIEKIPGSKNENTHLRFCLNHKPLFLHGLLDQGYWSDGLMTAPCDEAFVYDIRLAKTFGFNMLRKHIKIEPLRWYYHCDRMGMIVWQDMVSGGATYNMPLVCYLPTVFPRFGYHIKDHHYQLFSRGSEDGRILWEQECMDTIDHLYNVSSLAVWVPFNEGWGQFDAARIAGVVKEKDPARLVDHASGWFDQKGGDFRSIHNYFRTLRVRLDGKRAFVISEYGGYACHMEGHSSVDRIYGYQKYDSCEKLSEAYRDLMEKRLLPLEKKGLSGAVYTQLSDVEEEVNGLVTYDRKVIKITHE